MGHKPAAMSADDHDDRPKPSWKEIDQRRTGATARGSGRSDECAEARPSHAYKAYKSRLGKLFDRGGMMPGAGKTAAEMARAAGERALLLHTRPKALEAAALAYEAAFGLPRDAEVLMACLAVGHEPLLLRVVTALGVLVQAGAVQRTRALKARLGALLADCDAPKIIAGAKHILAAL